MRKTAVLSVALAFVLVLGLGPAFAGNAAGGVKLSGPHFQFNLIGHPNNSFSGDYSNGRSIMVPLRNVESRSELTCPADNVTIVDDQGPPTTSSEIVGGTRLYFTLNPDQTAANWEISDRDALDGRAEILVPLSALGTNNAINFDIYIRALGKPNTCMNINAYAYDAGGQLFYYAGSAYISRQKGRSVFVKANNLFDVEFCTEVVGGVCVGGYEVSVFADFFEEYFWQILNDGSRNVQVRIYPRVQ